MEGLLAVLGDFFRGLWVSTIVFDPNERRKDWSVTFIYKGEYVETPGFATPEEALKCAVNLHMGSGVGE